MVFGWSKKKQEEKPVQEEIPKETEIPISDVEKIVTDLKQLRKSQTVAEVKHLRNNTAPLIDDLIKIGKHLEDDDLDIEDIDKHLATIVIRGKKQVIDIIKKDVSPLQEISSIDDVKKLNSSLNTLLKKVGDVLGRQTRVIHIFAKKYASQLKDNLEVMNSNHSEIQNLLKNYNSMLSASDEITDALEQIDKLKKIRQEKIQKIDTATKNIESFDTQITSFQNSINDIKSSDDYKNYLELKKSLDQFTSQKTIIKNEIDAQFTKISRPLSRYEYGSSLDKDQKNILTKLVENPFDVLFPQNKDAIIVILENVKKGISSGSISVKDADKSLSQITETEESIDDFIKQVSEYLEKFSKLQNDLESANPAELVSLERDLEKNSSFKEDSALKSETFQGEVDEIDSKIPQLISDIEQKLRQFSNTKYTISTS